MHIVKEWLFKHFSFPFASSPNNLNNNNNNKPQSHLLGARLWILNRLVSEPATCILSCHSILFLSELIVSATSFFTTTNKLKKEKKK